MLTRSLVKYPVFASLVAIILAFFPWLDWLSSIIIAIMVFGEAITASIVTLLIVSALETWHYDFHLSLAAIADQLNFYLIWLGAYVLRKDRAWDKLMNGWVGIGLGIILLLHATIPHLLGYWEQAFSQGFAEANQVVIAILALLTWLPHDEWLVAFWGYLAQVFSHPLVVDIIGVVATSLWLASVSASTLFNLGVARWWQHKVTEIGHLHDELLALRLHRLLGVAMVLLALIYWLRPSWYWSLDAGIWMGLAMAICGYLYACWQWCRWPLPWLWIGLSVIAFCVYPLTMLSAIAILGTVDSLIDLRRFQR